MPFAVDQNVIQALAWASAADGWRRLGADMVMLYPMYRAWNFDGHIETLRRFKEVASG